MSRDDMDHRGVGRDADLVLSPGEYAFVQDGTKGNVTVYVGPHKTTISQTDNPVNWNRELRRFEPCSQLNAVHSFPMADEGSYIVLEDPAVHGKHPTAGSANQHTDLKVGRRVNLPGPASFSLWPGQHAVEIPGHRLRSNEYLIVRVLNDREAAENWDKAVVRPQTEPTPETVIEPGSDKAGEPKVKTVVEATDNETGDSENKTEKVGMMPTDDGPGTLVMGQLIMVPGNKVSFYIPPTGIEVVKDSRGQYVRQAVTLERLEYCILLDESGEKRYVKGPAVVFPSPTETFVEDKESKTKFRAIELNDIQGVYVKVIAEYEEDNGTKRKLGEELFIKGDEQAIYYPRPEHALIKYGEEEIHYAVVVPEGEARYVLDRLKGEIKIAKGPTMLLPDPRKEVIVRRILTDGQVKLWFPENAEAALVNKALRHSQTSGSDFLTSRDAARIDYASFEDASAARSEEDYDRNERPRRSATRSIAGETLTRRSTFTPPATVTVDERYEGAVRIDVWPGYAVLVVNKTGKRRVVVGPESTLLEFGEALLPMTLSTGRPKIDDNPIRTPYMKVKHNTVSDIVSIETKDLFKATIELAYRVNFEGKDPSKWFDIDNYVKYLTDHLRSMLRHVIKQETVENFYANATSIIRDCILGASPEEGERAGRLFEENGMRVYDVEVQRVDIDSDVYRLLAEAQRENVEGELRVAAKEKQLGFTQREEKVDQEILEAAEKTAQAEHAVAMAKAERGLETALARIATVVKSDEAEVAGLLAKQEGLDKIAESELSRKKAVSDQDLAAERTREEIATDAVVKRTEAISDDLIAALQAFGDKDLAGKALESMAPLAMLGGSSVADVANRMLKGTAFEGALTGKTSKSKD